MDLFLFIAIIGVTLFFVACIVASLGTPVSCSKDTPLNLIALASAPSPYKPCPHYFDEDLGTKVVTKYLPRWGHESDPVDKYEVKVGFCSVCRVRFVQKQKCL